MSEGRTLLRIDGAVAHITFDRPQARNAMTWRMYDELAQACVAIAGEPEVRVAVLRGAGGKAFVAGTDIEHFRSFASGEDGVAYEARVNEYVAAVETLPVPTVAIVEGWAVGGGLAIATACDLRVATAGARFGVPIAATLGNCLSAANLRRLSQALGTPWVKRMLLLAEMPDAETLAPTGYITAIVHAAELDAYVEALCTKIAVHAPLTMRATRDALRRLATDPQASGEDLMREVYGSDDFRRGVAAFLAKQPAQFRGS